MNKQEYARKLESLSRRKKHPLTMQLELTPLCTLNCKMCYVRLDHNQVEQLGGITTTEQWIRIIDEAIHMGVLNITLTGGEAMLHPGFRDIYQRAYDSGALVSVITNGTLITSEILQMFVDYPPESVSITLYGASSKTYAALCRNDTAYETVVQSIRSLVQNGVKVSLQTTLTKDNFADIMQIRNLADSLHIPYTFNNYLAPFGQCSESSVLENEVSKEVREKLLMQLNPRYREDQLRMIQAALDALSNSELSHPHTCRGMRCGAGNSSFQINWQGQMGLCTMMNEYRVDVRNGGLQNCWDELTLCANEIPQIPECEKCTYSNCLRCVAMHYADMKQYGIRSPRLCPLLCKEVNE